MSYLDEWAQLIAKQLKSEADLVGAQAKSDLYEDAARETFIRSVLEPFLPASYAVGAGRVIDSSGNISTPQDIVIVRKDYPQFNMPGSQNVFIYESVLATIQVCSKLVRKSFFSSLDQCASMGTLNPAIAPATLRAMASKMNMELNTQQQYVHTDPLNTGRFNLIGRPQSFVYAFTGYQTSDKQLTENLVKWFDFYQQSHDVLEMKSLPSVIATQGCFAWRNTAPFAINRPFLMGVGIDHAPLRLIFLQLMHALNRRLQNTSEGYGIKATIAPYLVGFEPPAISEMVGEVLNPGDKKPTTAPAARVDQVAVSEQMSATRQAQPVTDKSSTEKSSRIAKLAYSASKQAEVKNKGNPGTSRTDETHVEPATVEAERKEPLIQNRSTPISTRADSTSSQPSAKANRPKPSPLSLFSEGNEGEVEEYELNPIDKPMPSGSTDHSAHKALDSNDNGVQSVAKTDNSAVDKRSEGAGEIPNAQHFSSSPAQENDEEEGAFIDTLVETAESLAQDKSAPPARKSEYVTESLI